MRRVEKVLFGFLVTMLAGVVLAAAYVVIEHATRCDRFHFSAASWNDGSRNTAAHRLTGCNRLDGMSAERVETLLGKPEERVGRRSWSYDAGTDDGFIFSTSQTLEVRFGRDGRVRRAYLNGVVSD